LQQAVSLSAISTWKISNAGAFSRMEPRIQARTLRKATKYHSAGASQIKLEDSVATSMMSSVVVATSVPLIGMKYSVFEASLATVWKIA
jgi:hypothetical protein